MYVRACNFLSVASKRRKSRRDTPYPSVTDQKDFLEHVKDVAGRLVNGCHNGLPPVGGEALQGGHELRGEC